MILLHIHDNLVILLENYDVFELSDIMKLN